MCRLQRGQALEENLKLQQAAAATVASLKKLIQEKNATIERMQHRLDEVRCHQTIIVMMRIDCTRLVSCPKTSYRYT